MSKPKNNRVMCPECFKQKMLFETQKEADAFIKWNGDDIDTHGGTLRSYYCNACCGWHITSKPFKNVYEHSTENLIKRYEKDVMLSNAKTVEINISDYARSILKSIPKEINSKTKLKPYLTKYFEENMVENKKIQQDIRSEIYKLLKDGTYSIRTGVICNKVLSDEEIIEIIINSNKAHDDITFTKLLNSIIRRYKIIVSKERKKRLLELWYGENFKKHHQTKVSNEKTKEQLDEEQNNLEKVYSELIKEVPEINDPTPTFIRSLVDSFVKVRGDLPYLSAKKRGELKGMALRYYFKD